MSSEASVDGLIVILPIYLTKVRVLPAETLCSFEAAQIELTYFRYYGK
jgi:hypothetical protein